MSNTELKVRIQELLDWLIVNQILLAPERDEFFFKRVSAIIEDERREALEGFAGWVQLNTAVDSQVYIDGIRNFMKKYIEYLSSQVKEGK